ncbi:MAG: hypothetical protein QXI49_00830 [Candidatus Methanomethylicaceae archaeon]
MGGFGGVFVVIIIGILMLFSNFIIIKNFQSYFETIELISIQQTSSPCVISGYFYNNSLLFINITMQGVKGIPIRNLNFSDVFVTYRSQGKLISIKIDSWSPIRVFVNEKEGDIINPININDWSGIWDPGETLEFMISLPYPSDDSRLFFLMVMPDGGMCSWNL